MIVSQPISSASTNELDAGGDRPITDNRQPDPITTAKPTTRQGRLQHIHFPEAAIRGGVTLKVNAGGTVRASGVRIAFPGRLHNGMPAMVSSSPSHSVCEYVRCSVTLTKANQCTDVVQPTIPTDLRQCWKDMAGQETKKDPG